MTESVQSEVADTAQLMLVAEVAERVRLSHRTIRYYDDEGLLVAARSAGNYRLYSEADVQRLLLIREMKPLGFSLDDMRRLMDTLDRLDTSPEDAGERDSLLEFIALAKHRRDKLVEHLTSAELWIVGLDELARTLRVDHVLEESPDTT